MQLCIQFSCQTSRSTLWDHAYITGLICCYEVSSKVKASIYVQLLSEPLQDFRTRRGKFRAPKALAVRGVWGHAPPTPPRKFWNLEAQKCSCKHFPWHFSSEKSIFGKCRSSLLYSYWCQVNDHLHFKAFKCCNTYYNNKMNPRE